MAVKSVLTSSPAVGPSQVELGKPHGIQRYLESPVFKPKNFDLQVAADIKQVAIFQAAQIISGLQHWQNKLAPDQDVNLVFATGKSQLMAIAEVMRIKDNWRKLDQNEKALLQGLGVDFDSHSDEPFNPHRIRASHLDTIFPQSREALHSYAVQVNAFCDRLGISKDKRLLWYGDIKDPKEANNPAALLDAAKNRLPSDEYEKILASIKKEGLLVDKFKSGELDQSHSQYAYLQDMQSYLRAYADNLRQSGGGHIILFGVGSGYEGQGHVGFVEAEHLQHADNFLNMPAFIGLASHSALAGNIKANGGIDNAFTSEGNQTVGAATLSSQDFRFNPDAKIILTITGAGKGSTTRAFCENDISAEYPAGVLSGIGANEENGGKSVVIVGPSCVDDTIYGQLPELFDPNIIQMNEEDRPNFLTRALLAHNLRNPDNQRDISSITRSDIVALVYPNTDDARANKLLEKLGSLIPTSDLEGRSDATDPFKIAKDAVVSRIKNSLVDVDNFADWLGLEQGNSVLHKSPHLDDVTLAFGPGPLKALAEAGVRQHVVTATPGDSAVATTYVLNVLDEVAKIPEDEFKEIVAGARDAQGANSLEKGFLCDLRILLESSQPPVVVNDNHVDFSFWGKLSPEEQKLRAKLALLSLIRYGRRTGEGSVPKPYTDQRHVAALRDVLAVHSEESPEWTSPKQPEILRYVKEWIRVVEDQTAFMACEVAYDDYQPPMHPTWYTGGAERERTLSQVDIEQMKEVILKTKPKVIVLNGEGFMDHEAHCLTEMATRIALEQLVQENQLKWSCKVVLYRGVWDRTEVSASPEQMLLKMSRENLTGVDLLFRRHYRSQVPALVPDGGCPKTFFSERVIQNARKSADSLRHILGEQIYNENVDIDYGVLAFDVVDLTDDKHRSDFAARTRELEDELELVRESIERGALSRVVAKTPSVDLARRWREIEEFSYRAGLRIDAIFSEDEIKLMAGHSQAD
jgi:hypothetical protein